MLPIRWRCISGRWWSRRCPSLGGRTGNTEDDVDFVVVDFDSLYQSADHIPAGTPVELAEADLQSRGEFLQTPNNKNQVSLKLEFLGERLPIILQSAYTLLEATDARLKFGTANDPLGVAVDQSLNAATKPGDLAVKGIDVIARSTPGLSFRYSPPVLVRQSRGVLQHSLDLRPYSLFQLVASD